MKKKVNKKKKLCRPTVPNFFGDVSGNKEHFLRLMDVGHELLSHIYPYCTYVVDFFDDVFKQHPIHIKKRSCKPSPENNNVLSQFVLIWEESQKYLMSTISIVIWRFEKIKIGKTE